MIQGRKHSASGPVRSRSKRTRGAVLALAATALLTATACDEEAAGRAFRDAATASVQSGLKSVMEGVIDGMFAVFDLGTDQTGSSSSSGSSTSTSTSTSSSGSSSSSSGG